MDHAKVKEEVQNSASTVGDANKKEADNSAALICKTIAYKADACNMKA
ncbi:MAG TPA: hypothetical protein VFQ47_06565 [Nitrososphaera sp.]|jgi:hypothetical protein|nr:hypothetical protein [Nitrososphaera sp.]